MRKASRRWSTASGRQFCGSRARHGLSATTPPLHLFSPVRPAIKSPDLFPRNSQLSPYLTRTPLSQCLCWATVSGGRPCGSSGRPSRASAPAPAGLSRRSPRSRCGCAAAVHFPRASSRGRCHLGRRTPLLTRHFFPLFSPASFPQATLRAATVSANCHERLRRTACIVVWSTLGVLRESDAKRVAAYEVRTCII